MRHKKKSVIIKEMKLRDQERKNKIGHREVFIDTGTDDFDTTDYGEIL